MNRAAQTLEALYCGLLRLYPPRYRAEYAQELRDVFHLMLQAAMRQGGWSVFRLGVRELRDFPAALCREQLRERRPAMFAPDPGYDLSGWKGLVFFLPFLFDLWFVSLGFITFTTPAVSILAGGAAILLLVGLLVFTLIGLGRHLPLWALPGLGFWIGTINLILLFVFGSDVLGGFYRVLVRLFYGWPEGAFLLPFLNTFLSACLIWLPALLLTGLVVLLAARLPALRPFYNHLRQDRSLVSLLLYCGLLTLPLMGTDPYHGLQWFQLPGALVLTGGAWLYFRMKQPFVRLAVLCEAVFLAQALLAAGIYRLAPSQAYEVAVNSAKHWRYTLEPLAFAAFFMLVLCLPVATGLLRRKAGAQTPAA